jgi:hypothetical protein
MHLTRGGLPCGNGEKSAEAVVVKKPAERREERRAEEQPKEHPKPDCGNRAGRHPKQGGSGNNRQLPAVANVGGAAGLPHGKRERVSSPEPRERRRRGKCSMK